MDWLRQLPIGQFVAEEQPGRRSSWLRSLDPRLKLGWTLAFLITPILAGPIWRISLVGVLLLITAVSGLPWRLWRRSLPALVALAVLVGLLAAVLPEGAIAAAPLQRPPQELRLAPGSPLSPAPERAGERWEILRLGPVSINRRSAKLGLNGATLLFTLVHSANLLLISTPAEELVWSISWLLAPLGRWGWPVERLGFTLLLALRFLPLVQEELQNLLRSLATRAVNFKRLGWRAGLGLLLALGERLLANLLLRAEQGAEALLARGGRWAPPDQLHQMAPAHPWLNRWAGAGLAGLLLLRCKVGGF
ncbi:CbiQ family ECF transporter T component [Cyanobium sp. WAJ14-Wanaka]|uniref:CbiQ family ECF transporter T component n=1 Tax=Cyanobium sp. WAJ14-Wanaka TaxID=2823725 RepID=UPI0020CE695C|nr:CbiQ family ECF transporter T component [Cyanobium sp. WAJ14-Wanaka]MCP9774000.1 energy-coupling factor transporter transmembrane protein EcfT [Cyanobium sp. WAJ14-Wanaka]